MDPKFLQASYNCDFFSSQKHVPRLSCTDVVYASENTLDDIYYYDYYDN